MSGEVRRILPKTKYSFSSMTASSNTGYILIAKDVPIWMLRDGCILVRVHSKDIDTASNTFAIMCRPSAPTDEDPGVVFEISTAIVAETTVASSSTTTPALVKLTFAADADKQHGWMNVYLKAARSASGTLEATISIDLVTKD